MLDELVRRGGADGVRDMVIGMAHRGRLNVLVNSLGKAPQKLFAEFEGKFDTPTIRAFRRRQVSHGLQCRRKDVRTTVHLALAFNPSHLEIVNPVVAGSVRARQTRRKDEGHEQVLPVMIHGDAALAGQGVNMELLNMSQARGFGVGGSIHIVINNQIGFTISNPHDARSTLYCTDVAKMVNAPVLHVNGDDPEAVLFCTRLAFDFRQKFKRDIVIDLVCYRRHGHNEADEPAATQPLMYQVIRARPTARELYGKRLTADGVIAEADMQAHGRCLPQQARCRSRDRRHRSGLQGSFAVDWTNHLAASSIRTVKTGVSQGQTRCAEHADSTIPPNVNAASARRQDLRRPASGWPPAQQPMDWGFAENLAYATLVDQGFDLRLVGQDSGRGTFFHRHAVLHDQNGGHTFSTLVHSAQRSSMWR